MLRVESSGVRSSGFSRRWCVGRVPPKGGTTGSATRFFILVRRFLSASIIFLAALCALNVAPAAAQDEPQQDSKPKTESPAKQKLESADHPGQIEAESKNETQPKKYEYTKRVGIIYDKGDDYRLACDIYQPVGDGPFPGVLAIHGGAWRHGNKLAMLRHAWELASRGYVVVAINYRLAPDNKFPKQIHDCKTAVRWMRLKSKKLKLDPDRIAAFGYSAGAHLAAMLGTTDANDGFEGTVTDEKLKPFSTRVQCVIAGGAPCEFDWIKSKSLVYWLGHGPQEKPSLYKKAAPITYVSKDDPPFMFVHGTVDKVVPAKSSRQMHERLNQIGTESRYQEIEGKGHFATFSDLSWMPSAIDFMDEVMASEKGK